MSGPTWVDQLFNTQRWKEFQNHFHLLQVSEAKAQGRVLEQNRQIKVMETNLAILQNEMNEMRSAYNTATRELERLMAQQPGHVRAEVSVPKKQAAGYVSSSEKARRYQEQYRGGQIHSTPQDNSALLMQAHLIAQTEIYEGAVEASPQQRAEIRGENRESSMGYREPIIESRPAPQYQAPEPSRSGHHDTPSHSDRNNGWGGDSGGSSDAGGGGGGD